MNDDRRIRFGGFDFDPDTGELTRSGASVARLQDQPCRVLDALTSNAGRLVTREELHKRLWPENSLVDADNGLNIAINKIRLALEDSAATPRFIQTVPRRGYKFIGHVVEQRCFPGATPDHVQVTAAAPTAATPAIPVTRARYLRPVLAASLTLALATTGARWFGSPVAPTVHTAAVMPFANLTGDPGLDYAGQGLTDTLATGLAMRGMPRVISSDATAYYKASNLSLGQIAGELHADALVLGSIVRDGASFAVNVRVVDGRTQQSMWAKRFVRAAPMEVTFSDDVLADLAPALRLASSASSKTTQRPQAAAEARNEYLRGRYFWNLRTASGLELAVEHLTRALEAQQDYAVAWAGLAEIYAVGGEKPSSMFKPWPGEPVEAGVQAAHEAMRLDPSLGEAHAALGKLRMAQWRWTDAEQELAAAVRLSPNDATARQWYGTLLSRLQKCPDAIEQAAIGGEIDPITPIVNEAVGTTLAACGQPQWAIPAYKRVLTMHPEFASTHMRLAGAYMRLGDAASALTEYREAVRLRPNNCEFQARMTRALTALGDVDEARAIAMRIAAEAVSGRGSQFCAAVADANTGDIDRAFAALDAEVSARSPSVAGLLADFHLRALHADRRWPRLIDRIGLTSYARWETANADGRSATTDLR
jgi:DNA-binding winged helix-turn-helix (wHTH) protein/TolB-like protein/tetratricopeptide (TPR) repeat protein